MDKPQSVDTWSETTVYLTSGKPISQQKMDSQHILDQGMGITAQQDSDKCYFLRLPRELRDQIYDLVVTAPHKLRFDVHTIGRRALPHPPALTKTCRQIQKESSDRYCKCNVFRLTAIGPPVLPRIITDHIDQIHHFEIDHIRVFFDLDLSKGLRQYKFGFTDYGPKVGFWQWQLMPLEEGSKYLEQTIDRKPQQAKMTPKILLGLIEATSSHRRGRIANKAMVTHARGVVD